MAGLDLPKDIEFDEEDNLEDAWEETMGFDRRPHHRRVHFEEDPKVSSYHKSRERFASSIDWKKYNQLYQQAVVDMNADFATEGLVANHAGRRRSMIAGVLSKLRLKEETTMVEQLVAIRRLSLLFDEHFETLHMEEFGRLWENCHLVLTPTRPYNTSSSALHKRRLQRGDTGFSFTLHPDFSVTIEIPIDFRDDELIVELERNLWDIYELREADDGFESVFSKYAM
jgi:hypothetical protein